MKFQPRLLASGRVCCESPDALCATCAKYHGLPFYPIYDPMRTAQGVRATVGQMRVTGNCGCPKCVAARKQAYNRQPPPNGYAMALDRDRPRTYESSDENDGYAAALRKGTR